MSGTNALILKRSQPSFKITGAGSPAACARFILGQYGEIASPRKSGETSLLLSFTGSEYSPSPGFSFSAIGESPAATVNSLVYSFQAAEYTPQATFAILETTLQASNAQIRQIIPSSLVFRMQSSLDLVISRRAPRISKTASFEFARDQYPPESFFKLFDPLDGLYRFLSGDYTPGSHFVVPRPGRLETAVQEPGTASATIEGILSPLSGQILGSTVANQAVIQGFLSSLEGQVVASYDYNVNRPITFRPLIVQENAGRDFNNVTGSQENSLATSHQVRESKQSATWLVANSAIRFEESILVQVGKVMTLESASKLTRTNLAKAEALTPTDLVSSSPFQFATPVNDTRTALFDRLYFKREHDWSSVLVNTFETQHRHLRTYYNPVEPFPYQNPGEPFRFSQKPEIYRPPVSMDVPPVMFHVRNRGYVPTYAFFLSVVPQTFRRQVNNQELEFSFAGGEYTPQASFSLSVAEFIPKYVPNFFLGSGEYSPYARFIVEQVDTVGGYYKHPIPDKPAGVLDHTVFPGRSVFGTFVNSDTKGTVFNKAETRLQIARANKPDWLCPLENANPALPPGKSPWIDPPRPKPPITPPGGGGTVVIPTQRSYTMINDVTVTLEDLTPVKMKDFRLSFDADSYAWQFSGTLLDPGQVDDVKPAADGSPVKLLFTVNGQTWTMLSDLVSRTREFGKQTVGVSGRGLSALIAEPFAQPQTGTQGSLLSVSQLMASHLPPGWSINYQIAAWNVDGGAYSFQNRTALQAVSDLAQFAGAIVLPGRSSQVLTIKPRYPVLPWDFDTATPDVIIPESVITSITYRQASKQFPNGVYVHGGEIGGEIGFCRLNGTAGDVLIETQTNPIMTDVVGLRALGERLLAGEYSQPEIASITTPLDGVVVPLVEVGTFVQVNIDSEQVRAIVSGVEISYDGQKVKQTIKLGEDSGNKWLAFKRLLPADPLLLGTLASTNGNTSTITLLGGGVVNVRGTGTVGQKYYIRGGQIVGDAPSLTQHEIVI